MTDTVTISREEYELLKEDSEFLERLEEAGLDNWEGFSAVKWGDDEEDEGYDDDHYSGEE